MQTERLLIDLGVISQLKEGDKLAVIKKVGDTKLVIDSGSSVFQGVYRYWYGCNRADVLTHLWSMEADCEAISNVFMEPCTERTASMRLSIHEGIRGATAGLANLRLTYATDSHTTSIISRVIARLHEYEKRIVLPSSRHSNFAACNN